MTEIKRVLLSPRRLLVLLLLLLLCAYQSAQPDRWQMARETRANQEALLETYGSISLDEALDELNLLTNNGAQLTRQYSSFYNQVTYLADFQKELERIQTRAKGMSTVSIFAGSPYAQANIRKTASDYARLEGTELTLGMDAAVERVMEKDGSDWLLGIWMLVVVCAFLAERRRGLWNVVCASARGRVALPMWRLVTLILAALTGAVTITLTELAVSYSLCGGIRELGRMVQSIPMFFNLTIPMTIGQFWLLYIGLRFLGALFLGFMIWFLFEMLSDRRMAAAALAAVLGTEYVLATRAGADKLLGTVNLFSFLHPRALVLDYQNLNLFGKPVGQMPLVLWGGAGLSLVAAAIVLLRYRKRRPTDSYAWLDRLGQFRSRLTAPLGYHTGLLAHSLHQILSVGKGALILLAALAVAFTMAEPPYLGTNQPEEILYESYLRRSQGPVTDETHAYLLELEEKLAQDQAEYQTLLNQLNNGDIDQDAFEAKAYHYQELGAREMAISRYRQYLLELEPIENAHVLPHWVYQSLFGIGSRQPQALLGLCMVTSLLVFVFQSGTRQRSGMAKSQQAAPYGRLRLQLTQHLSAWIVTFLFCALVWALQFGRLWASYSGGLPFPDAPAPCLTFLQDAPAGYTVLGHWLALSLKQTLLTCAWSSGILLITGGLQRKR